MDPTVDLDRLNLAGLNLALSPSWERPENLEVEDDIDGEQDTLLPAPSSDELEVDLSTLEDTLAGMSKGVTEKTDSEYRGCVLKNRPSFRFRCNSSDLRVCSQMMKCRNFLVSYKLIKTSDPFFSDAPSHNAPSLITAWIMQRHGPPLLASGSCE